VHVQRPGFTVELAVPGLRRPEVGGSSRHDEDVGRREPLADGGRELAGGLNGNGLDARRRRNGHVGGHERHVGAAPGGLLGQGQSHPSGRPVADEADRVDRLPRAARRHQHPQSIE
jgi:hypothetical protein